FTFNLFKKDSSFLNYETDIGLRFYHEGRNYFRLFWNAEASDPISTLGQNINNSDFAKFRKNYFGLGIFQNQLDKQLNPSSGLLFDVRLAYGNVRRWLKETDKNSELKAKLDMSFFISVSKSMTIHLRNQTAFINQYSGKKDSAGLFLTNELFRIGGLNTLRGFDEESIFAHWYTVGTIEYRFLLDQGSSFYFFYDQAFYEAMYQNKQFVEDAPLGLGVGFHLSTPAGLLKINYAFGKQFDNPLDMRAGKIHLGISTRF
ncbi:MAG: BamA/TamA family outer membrane protein, partial [Bacteroidota bacterium]